jgi:hypothetical protein
MRASGVLWAGWTWQRTPVCGVHVLRRLAIAVVVALAMTPAVASAVSWSPQSVPSPQVANGGLGAVSCPTTTFCVSVGSSINPQGLTVAYARAIVNGAQWVNVSVPLPAGALVTTLSKVSCSSPTACTAVGSYEPHSGGTLPLVERFDGSKITIQPTPAPGPLVAVSCPSASYCVAVGQSTTGQSPPFAMSWNGSTWTVQTLAAPAGAFDVGVSDVACSSPSACTAVGSYAPDQGLGSQSGVTLAERWNGTAWSVQQTDDPSDATTAGFSGVACVSDGSCQAVGDYSVEGNPPLTLAESWNGSSWSLQATPEPSVTPETLSYLSSVSCTAPWSCTAVGATNNQGPDGQQATAEHWNGQTWSIQYTPLPPGDIAPPFDAFGAVSCPSATLCIAVGHRRSATTGMDATLTDRWDGARWTIVPAYDPDGAQSSGLASVSCVSAVACMAVGSTGSDALADRWDGSAWTTTAVPASNGLNVVSCADASDCMAVGGTGPDQQLAVEHWDGSAWTIQATPELTNVDDPEASSVSCTSPSACTLVGSYYAIASGQTITLAERSNGTAWTLQRAPVPPGGGAILITVSCTSDASCTAVGYYSPGPPNDTDAELIEHWDGTTWSIQPAGTPYGASATSLSGVSCVSAICEAVGSASRSTQIPLAQRYG